ncbi:ComF family protein [Agreia sp. VKM Ac-1783]|uniref:ComF family protein n=1 Tax=Agreia sp. VKM Ac-1783 TaxID=1938889 RepID=UPI000A2ACB78|nr:ComF family protein [Agreia sp. VKM Ac-1783]SMQ60819.1 Predicted amidophosphoribosyltransferases [Agreia sp. VKM Ac-1783]
MDARGLVSEAILDALAVLFPVECAGCGAADRGICAACRGALTLPDRAGRHLLRAPGAKSGGDGLPLWFAVAYDGVPKQILHALKEAGRLDGARPLGRLLGVAVADAVEAIEPRLPTGARLETLVVPSSRSAFRLRGYNPVESLLRWAGLQPRRATGLRYRRTPRDQATLGADERWANLSGSIEAVSGRLEGRHLLLIDDVVTTGATLLECRRAAEAGGASVWGAAALAHTAKVKRTNSELHGDLVSPQVYGGGKGAESNRPRLGRRVLD